MTIGRRTIKAAGLAAVLVLAVGCGGASSATPPSTGSDAAPPLPTGIPTLLPELLTASGTAAPQPEVEPTLGPGAGNLPLDMTGYELIAASIGEAVYSGYSCTIAPVGCSCETPVIERISFTFTSDYRMSYRFSGEGYSATWEMTRLGPNNWWHTLPLYDESGQVLGALTALLTFTTDGFLYNLGASYLDGSLVTCPDVVFRRMMTPTQEP